MTTVRRHTVSIYFALVFLISWGGGLLILGPEGLPMDAAQFASYGPWLYVAILGGPSLAGILMTAIVDGRRGLRELGARLRRWRAAPSTYALALVPALAITVAALLLSLVSPNFRPGMLDSSAKTTIVLSALVPSILIGSFEEIGWTGFAVPHLRARHSVLTTGLMIGVVWGAWHLPLFWQHDTLSGALPLAILFTQLFAWLPPFRVLLIRFYEHSQSLPLVMLAHAAVSFVSLILAPEGLTGAYLLTSIFVTAATMWLLLAVVGTSSSRALSGQEPERRSIGQLASSQTERRR